MKPHIRRLGPDLWRAWIPGTSLSQVGFGSNPTRALESLRLNSRLYAIPRPRSSS